MTIGVLKERKRDERRVALQPSAVDVLTRLGNEVLIEQGAGVAAGFPDTAYSSARVVCRDELYSTCSLLVKVKCPEPEEYAFLRPQHVLFTFLHFDENISPERISTIAASGATGIAFEWVQERDVFPILQPMSELTGRIFAFRSMALLLEYAGVIGGAGQRPKAMVIGLGHIGANAANVLVANGFDLVIVDKHPDTIHDRMARYMSTTEWHRVRDHVTVAHFDETKVDTSVGIIRSTAPDCDIVICSAVRRPTLPKSACEFLLDRETVARMRPNRVVCDATACDHDFVETAISSDSLADIYHAEGVIHYNCDHIPSLAARTATELLSQSILPYVTTLAGGLPSALNASPALTQAVMCYQGRITHQYSAVKKGLPYTELASLI